MAMGRLYCRAWKAWIKQNGNGQAQWLAMEVNGSQQNGNVQVNGCMKGMDHSKNGNGFKRLTGLAWKAWITAKWQWFQVQWLA